MHFRFEVVIFALFVVAMRINVKYIFGYLKILPKKIAPNENAVQEKFHPKNFIKENFS